MWPTELVLSVVGQAIIEVRVRNCAWSSFLSAHSASHFLKVLQEPY